MPSVLFPLADELGTCFGSCTGISFVDSTSLKVCHNRRINSHRVFADLAARTKTSLDWFFGFKLHFVVNDHGERINVVFTPGNVDDRKPLPKLLQRFGGKVFGDQGGLSAPLALHLWKTISIQLMTRLRRGMKGRGVPLIDRLLLRRRAILESVIAQLKNISQIEHSRHRSPVNF